MIPKKKRPDDPDYRSKFEQTIGEFLGTNAEHEPERIYFTQPSKQRFYLPDFKTKGGAYIECKGKWDASDRIKHVWLREQHPEKRIAIIFQNAKVRLSKKSKTTYGEWATKNNIEWYDWKDGIPAELLTYNANRQDNRNPRGSSRNQSKPDSGTSTVSAGSGTKRGASKGSKAIPKPRRVRSAPVA
jgi:hypothetical protein